MYIDHQGVERPTSGPGAVRSGRNGRIPLPFALLLAAAFTTTLGSAAHAQDIASEEPKEATLKEQTGTTTQKPGEEAEPYLFRSVETVEVVPAPEYRAGAVRSWIFGRDYRDVWATPLEVPVIDLDATAGGLTPIERGGGMQTTSLHLMGEDGHEYRLRSVDKTAARSVPEGMRGTFIQSIIQDQISSLNPVGALAIPPLARAAGVLHTAPTLVIIPDSPRLGEYREEFAGMLAQFERKPDEDQSEAARFGNAKNVVGSDKLFEEIVADNDHRVDERAYARARLFDMLVGDWDRHDDQWRWAEYEEEDGVRYVPVGRDRDFAFVQFDGLMHRLGRMSGSMMTRRMVNFDEEISDVVGLNWQGSKLDRRLTSSLTRTDWVAIADSLRRALSDEVIEDAIRVWPEPVYAQIGPETIRTLKSRRDQLPEVAARYYEKLAVTVDVVGTDKHERFEVNRLNDHETRVVVHKTKKEGDVVHTLFDRVFQHDETREVRLYGLGGNDQFVFEGEARDGLLVRAIGGPGEDTFQDASRVRGPGKLTHIYDTVENTVAEVGPETKRTLSTDIRVNTYEMDRFAFHTAGPILAFDYNSNEGPFFGAGVHLTRRGFRKQPYAARHQLGVTYAPRTSAYNVFYESHLVGLWNGLDGVVAAEVLAENNFRDFYGLGNETPSSDRLLYNARLRTINVSPAVRRPFGKGSYVEAGPVAEFVRVGLPAGREATDPAVGFTPEELTDKYYAGFRTDFAIDSRDSTLNPRRGLFWLTQTEFAMGVHNTSNRLGRLSSDLRFYYTLPLPSQVTLALRAGGATNVGDFEFFQANMIGGSTNLRGYPRNRFAGRSAVFTNAELRAKLFDFNLYLTAGELGIFGFYDRGRVWVDDENSGLWHEGYGGGLWVTPFRMTVVSAALAYSDRGRTIDFSLGFQF